RMFLGGTAPIPARTLRRALHISHAHHQTRPTGVTLARTSDAALVQARTAAPNLPFALEYPRARHIYGAALPDTLRLYDIRDPHGRLHPAYVVVVDGGPLGQFYDVQATSWAEPPLLSNPTQTVRDGARRCRGRWRSRRVSARCWRARLPAPPRPPQLPRRIAPPRFTARAGAGAPAPSPWPWPRPSPGWR